MIFPPFSPFYLSSFASSFPLQIIWETLRAAIPHLLFLDPFTLQDRSMKWAGATDTTGAGTDALLEHEAPWHRSMGQPGAADEHVKVREGHGWG